MHKNNPKVFYQARQLVSKFRHHNKVLFCGVSLLDQGLPLNADRIKVDDTVGRSAFVLIKHTRPTAGSHFLLDRVNQSDSKGMGGRYATSLQW